MLSISLTKNWMKLVSAIIFVMVFSLFCKIERSLYLSRYDQRDVKRLEREQKGLEERCIAEYIPWLKAIFEVTIKPFLISRLHNTYQ